MKLKKTTGMLLGLGLLALIPSVNAESIKPDTEIKSYQVGEVTPVVLDDVQPTADGAWVNSGTGPSLYTKSQTETLQINPIGVVSSSNYVTIVNYKWNLSYIPSGLTVSLCHNTLSTCWNVTNMQNGSLDIPDGTYAANKPWIFAFTVAGSGAVSPTANGRMDEVIVNFN